MFTYKSRWGDCEKCEFVKQGSGIHTRYFIFSMEEGPICDLNLPGYTSGLAKCYQKESVVAIKDYSENEGTLDFLKNLGVVKQEIGKISSGFVRIPVVELDVEKLMSLNDCREISYTGEMVKSEKTKPAPDKADEKIRKARLEASRKRREKAEQGRKPNTRK